MPAIRPPIASHSPHRQRGAAFMVMLVILIIGAVTILVSALNSSSVKIARDQTTADALAKAKEALIGYAVTYGDNPAHSLPQVDGYLPCPDPNGSAGVNGEGSSETCGNQNVSAIGRLPWKTLGLSPLRDGNGECLWYAVSGSYKNNPMTYNLMNWDNKGLFQILAANGVTLAGQPPGQLPDDTQVLAVIFSPGVVLGGQNRTPDGKAPICGGNYTASNYLDSDATVSANNATPSTVANAISQFFTAGATTNINDQIIYITKGDIFNAIKKRNDFGTATVAALLNAATSCGPNHPKTLNFNNNPPTENPGGGIFVGSGSNQLEIGRIPQSCLQPPVNNLNYLNNWQDNLLFATCTSGGSCLTVNGTGCDGVIVFAGERNASQVRITATDKNTWGNYLEGSTLAAFQGTTTNITGAAVFTGAPPVPYNPVSPSTDIVVCL